MHQTSAATAGAAPRLLARKPQLEAESRGAAGVGAPPRSGNRQSGGGSGPLTYRGVSFLLPPGGALAREARGRWQCPVFRAEAAEAVAAAAAGTGIVASWVPEH